MEIRRTELAGIPVFWADSALPFVAGILVRVGAVDETLLTAGMSHLLEHLVLSTDWPVDEFNASVTPLSYLEYPSPFVYGPEGVAGASMVVQRSHEIVVAYEVIEHRLRQWLRHQEGVTYHVGSSYEPISAETAVLVVRADCRPAS